MSGKEAQLKPIGNDSDEIEVRLSDIKRFLSESRRFILLGVLVGALVGGLYAFSKRDEYTSVLTVMPEIQQKSNSMGNLSSLAGLAGIDVSNLTGSTDVIRPDLYPNVAQSVPFGLQLLQQPVKPVGVTKPMSLDAYLEETDRSWLDNFSFSSDSDESKPKNVSDPDLLRLTKNQEEKIKSLQSRLPVIYDKKSGIITIQSVMHDPVVAATTVRYTLNYLTDYITSYRTEKARKEVAFLAEQMKIARKRYQDAEYTLSSYRDRNRNLFLNTAKIEEQRLQADYLLAQDVYNTLAKQYETAKIKVAEDTPVFKVLEPARVPLKKSGPKRSIIIVVGALLGGFVVIAWRLVRLLLTR